MLTLALTRASGGVVQLGSAALLSTLEVAGSSLRPVGSAYELRATGCATLGGKKTCGSAAVQATR